jgi:soluble lytic murein transglycosylase-like protein
VAFDGKRLLSDPIYNVQMGAAELGDLIVDYRGSISSLLSATMPAAGDGTGSRFGDPRDQRRSDRLGRADPVLGDTQLRPRVMETCGSIAYASAAARSS